MNQTDSDQISECLKGVNFSAKSKYLMIKPISSNESWIANKYIKRKDDPKYNFRLPGIRNFKK